MPNERILTKELAEQFLADRYSVNPGSYSALEIDAAKAISKYKGYDLNLSGLADISDAAAEAISKYKGGRLSLSGLTNISDAAAEALSSYNGSLELNGLIGISVRSANALSTHKGDLSLKGLTSLSDAAAEVLSKRDGELDFSVTNFSNPSEEPLSPQLWAHLCDRNGYIREKAMRLVSGPAPDAESFEVAMQRLNDWVPQVRDAARENLIRIANQTDPEIVVDVLFKILRKCKYWVRFSDLEQEVLLKIISTERIISSLRTRILVTSSGQITVIISEIGRCDAIDPFLIEIAIKSIQPAARAYAFRCLLKGSFEWRVWIGHWTQRSLTVKLPFNELLTLAVRDQSSIVRRQAGDVLCDNYHILNPSTSLELANILAQDKSISVAERGKWVLNRMCTT